MKYLGYVLRTNNTDKEVVRERVKKAQVAIRAILGIGERKFKGDFGGGG